MTDELISREALINKIGLIQLHFVAHGDNKSLFDIINELPSVDAVVLPCKVGDTVYEIHNNTEACRDCDFYCCGFGDAWCEKVEDTDLREYPDIAETPLCEKQFVEIREYTPNVDWIFRHRAEFGETIFLTREEAEKALEGREDNAD